jgi:hypothetical protein
MESNREYDFAYEMALILLKREREKGNLDTSKMLENVLDRTLAFPECSGKIDRSVLRRRLEMDLNIFVPAPFILDGFDGEHRPWLDSRRNEINWQLWRRYERYLRQKNWPSSVIESINKTTNMALDRLEDPSAGNRRFDRRGMVVGQVQSGKTANYTGLMCKAVDAGYRIVLVLAGNHDNLRSQTQTRLDEEFLGYDTAQFESGIGTVGVGLIGGVNPTPISVTTRDQKGDFSTAAARRMPMQLGGIPILLVVKKNVTILRTIYNYFIKSRNAREDPVSGHPIVDGVPLLMIDDEADLASVNTADIPTDEKTGNPIDNYNPTKINEWIRRILSSFGMKAYVGYTATPFANIFIPPESVHRELGPDLFPESFIITLSPPSDYIGPVEVFGLSDDGRPPLPVIRHVDDFRSFIPNRHKPDFRPGALPESLKTAMKSFILSCAIRRIRNQGNSHNSMLIHVTRFTQVQQCVGELVNQELQSLSDRIKYGDGKSEPSVRKELRSIWENDNVPASQRMGNRHPDETWERIEEELVPAVLKIRIRIINGRTDDILDYRENSTQGTSLIAIGGDKLSRGLTLDGLTVSYFLRATKLYDTLMQMGRWFGYHLDYEDLCRIYLTHELSDWFGHITLASEELRREFEFMMAEEKTPRDYGLRVRSHPSLMVTSRVKMRSSEEVQIHYQATLGQTRLFDISPNVVGKNFAHASNFIEKLDLPSTDESNHWYVWRKVPGSSVSRFLEGYSTHTNAEEVKGKYLSEYIDAQLERNELTDWTIAMRILDPSADQQGNEEKVISIGKCRIRASRRTPFSFVKPCKLDMHAMASKDDELLDLTNEQKRSAREQYGRAMEMIRDVSGQMPGSVTQGESVETKTLNYYMRKERDPKNALLILYMLDSDIIEKEIRHPSDKLMDRIQVDDTRRIEFPLVGFAVCFPPSKTAVPVRYRVNTVYSSQAAGGNDDQP